MAASTSSGSSSLVKVLPPEASALPSLLMATRLIEQPVDRSSALHTAAHLMSIFIDSSLFHAFPPAWLRLPTPGRCRLFFPGKDRKTAPRSGGRTPSAVAPRSFFQGPCPPLLRSGLWLPTEGSTRSRRPVAPA